MEQELWWLEVEQLQHKDVMHSSLASFLLGGNHGIQHKDTVAMVVQMRMSRMTMTVLERMKMA